MSVRYLLRLLIILAAIAFPVLAAGLTSPQPAEVVGLVHHTGPSPRPVIVYWPPTPAPGEAEPTPEPTPEPTVAPAEVRTPAPTAVATAVTTAPPTPRPTARPTAPPAATPAPTPVHTYDPEDVKRRVRSAWPGDGDEAIAVVDCETGGSFDPRMTSANGMYKGLWQFHQKTWERNGGTGDPRDASPEEQTRIAWNLYQKKGWEPWPSCRPDAA